jgi:hypothetical protein
LKFEGKSQKNMVKQVADNGEIRGISMLWRENEEIISQYVNDTSLSMVGEEENVDKMVDLQGIDSYWFQHWSSIAEKTWHTSRNLMIQTKLIKETYIEMGS